MCYAGQHCMCFPFHLHMYRREENSDTSPTDSEHSIVQHMTSRTAVRMSLDNRRRYLEKIFHFPCGVEPVASTLIMQVILEEDSRASFPIVSPTTAPVELTTSPSSRNVSANKRNTCTSSPCITTATVSFEGSSGEVEPYPYSQTSLAASNNIS
jgi:hypothetical protein